MVFHRCLVSCRLLAVVFMAMGLQPTWALEQPRPSGFDQEIKPLLKTYCIECHGTKKQKGHINFSLYDSDDSALAEHRLWRKTIEQLESAQMPPDDEPQPTAEQRARLINWMKSAAVYIDPASARRDPGPALIRRLSRAEYDRTVFDLLGVEFDSASLVGMGDDTGPGNAFGNIAAALEIPPSVMERYFVAADLVLDRFFGTDLSTRFGGAARDRAKAARERLFGVPIGSWNKPEEPPKLPAGLSERDAARNIITDVAARAFRTPTSAQDVEALLSLYDKQRKAGRSFVEGIRLVLKAVLVSPRFLYRIERDVPATTGGVKTIGISAHRISDHELATRLSYFLWSSMPDAQLTEAADKGELTRDDSPAEPTQLGGAIIGSANDKNPEHALANAFDGDPFTFYEGPDNDGDWAGLDLGEPKKITAIKYAPMHYQPGRMRRGKFQVSSSADFSRDVIDVATIDKEPRRGELTVIPVDPPGAYRYVRFLSAPGGHCSIAEFQVWGIDQGTMLHRQIRRMLADTRASALTSNFAVHWLELDKLPLARPSTEFFPDFQPEVRESMYRETYNFFDHLRGDDRSILDLLDADYTYLDERLAKYYKIPDVKGEQMRRVALKPEYHRGGLLRMGSVLAVTSHTYRTSPTLRGKYVLDVIFGTPPPPPPANAGMFKDEKQVKEAKSFRELLANHARDPSCAVCHKKLDPLGFSLENFTAAGAWRESTKDKPLDNVGVLPTGETIHGIDELRKLILQRKADFARNFVEQLLIYALGRDLDNYDDATVKQIVDEAAAKDYRLSAIIEGIATSYPFQYRRDVPQEEPRK